MFPLLNCPQAPQRRTRRRPRCLTYRYASVSTPCHETMNAAGVRWHRRVEATSCSSCGEEVELERGESSESSLMRAEEEGPAEAAAPSSPSARAGGGGQVVATGGGREGGDCIEAKATASKRARRKMKKTVTFLHNPRFVFGRAASPFSPSSSLFSLSFSFCGKTRSLQALSSIRI